MPRNDDSEVCELEIIPNESKHHEERPTQDILYNAALPELSRRAKFAAGHVQVSSHRAELSRHAARAQRLGQAAVGAVGAHGAAVGRGLVGRVLTLLCLFGCSWVTL